jgi:hypothetical protein
MEIISYKVAYNIVYRNGKWVCVPEKKLKELQE